MCVQRQGATATDSGASTRSLLYSTSGNVERRARGRAGDCGPREASANYQRRSYYSTIRDMCQILYQRRLRKGDRAHRTRVMEWRTEKRAIGAREQLKENRRHLTSGRSGNEYPKQNICGSSREADCFDNSTIIHNVQSGEGSSS